MWEVHGGDNVMATWGFELDPGREDVRVRQWARMGPDPSGLNIAIDADAREGGPDHRQPPP